MKLVIIQVSPANYRDWGHCWYKARQHPSFDPIYEGEAMFAVIGYRFMVGT